MPKTATQKLELSRAYTYAGHTYGPGSQVEVPDDAADSIREKEDEYQQYLAEGGEPHPPVTPSGPGEAMPDPRLRKPGTVRRAAESPGQSAEVPQGANSPAVRQQAAPAPAPAPAKAPPAK